MLIRKEIGRRKGKSRSTIAMGRHEVDVRTGEHQCLMNTGALWSWGLNALLSRALIPAAAIQQCYVADIQGTSMRG